MFDFAWSEIAIIAAVALVVIGPKDLPVALRAVSGFVKKARRMAGEFQTHVDEMMREADLKDVKDSLNEIRNFDFRGTMERAYRSGPDAAGHVQSPIRSNRVGRSYVRRKRPRASLSLGDEPVEDPVAAPTRPLRVAAPPFVPPALVPFVNGPDAPAEPPPLLHPRHLSFPSGRLHGSNARRPVSPAGPLTPRTARNTRRVHH